MDALDLAETTLTFLFSDIEGSTRLEQEVGTRAYAEVRERHRALLRAAFATCGGAEQGTEGDSFFVVFPTARGAITAAVAAQRAVAAEPWPPEAPIRVRMGIHSGEARAAGGSLVGLDINRAARIAGVAHGGQVLVSDATRTLVGGDALGDIAFRDLGPHRLKDLLEPQHLFQLVADGLRAEFPLVRSLDGRRVSLPTQLTSFVGRDGEVAAAGRLLAEHRLVTLTGPGGTGKTRLSLQVAADASDAFADGVRFVSLAAVRDPGLVASQIATSVGLIEAGNRPTRDLLADWLAGKAILLVLDNFEQVIDAAPLVADLLRSAPGLKLLVTSRAALRISGEHEYPVPGLPTPPDLSELTALERAQLPARERSLEADALAMYESVELFVARATAVRPGFQVTNENAASVAAICARLRGMPLAIELAAARVRLLTPEAILGRLAHQLATLAGGARDLPERQQTLRGAIAWSYDILDEPGRRLLERLSVFRGGIDLAAAEAVCGTGGLFGDDLVDAIGDLADQSLLRVLDAPEPRFAMLETIREFAGEMLDGRAEAAVVRGRFRAWFLDLARSAAPELAGSDQRTWLDRLELEHDNLRAAIDRAAADGDGETAIGLAFALWRFWQQRGHLAEARRRLEGMAAEPWSYDSPSLRARLMEALGGVCWWQGDIEAMQAPYGEAVELWRADGDRRELANALYNHAFCFSFATVRGTKPGDPDPGRIAWAALDEALGIYRELGDEGGEANVLWGMGNYRYFGGEPGAGADEIEAALAIHRRLGNRTMEAWSLHMFGLARLRTGDRDVARASFREAMGQFHDSGDTAGMTLVLDDFASLAAADGDPERAARLWGAARTLTATTGTGLAQFVDESFDHLQRPTVRGMIDAAEVERLAAEGASLTVDEAVAYALGDAEPGWAG
jgi:predicted ATPase/class 3 adenylate cyclase